MTDVAASLRFYVDQLGFTSPWQYAEDGKPVVAQVDRQGCALLLSSQWPDKVGKSLVFISLDVEPDTPAAQVAALDALRTEFEARGAPVKDGSWATGSWWSTIQTAISSTSTTRTSPRSTDEVIQSSR